MFGYNTRPSARRTPNERHRRTVCNRLARRTEYCHMDKRRRYGAAVPASTDALIASLAAEIRPAARVSSSGTLRDALFGGALVTILMFFACLGLRSDITTALLSGAFWMKIAYPSMLAALAWRAIDRLGAPDVAAISFTPLLLPIAGLALVVAGTTWLGAPADGRFWLGTSWARCPLYVAALATPMTARLLWSFRDLAPTRLSVTGFLTGLASGAIGAAVYSLGCGETSPGFLLVWYSLGLLLPAVVGAMIAPWLLRW